MFSSSPRRFHITANVAFSIKLFSVLHKKALMCLHDTDPFQLHCLPFRNEIILLICSGFVLIAQFSLSSLSPPSQSNSSSIFSIILPSELVFTTKQLAKRTKAMILLFYQQINKQLTYDIISTNIEKIFAVIFCPRRNYYTQRKSFTSVID